MYNWNKADLGKLRADTATQWTCLLKKILFKN